MGTGEVFGECKPTRNGADFLAFVKKAVKPHQGQEIHIVMDNLSTHTTPDAMAWLEKNPHVHFHFAPVGSSWINQISAPAAPKLEPEWTDHRAPPPTPARRRA